MSIPASTVSHFSLLSHWSRGDGSYVVVDSVVVDIVVVVVLVVVVVTSTILLSLISLLIWCLDLKGSMDSV